MFKLNYFHNHLSRGFVALFSGRMIQFTARGLLELFVPIFLLTQFNFNISYVFLYYLIGHLTYALILPWGAGILNKIGLRRSLRISIFFNAGVYACFFLLDYNFWFFIILSFILLTLFRVTFWYPFHIDFAKFTNFADRGKSVGLLWAAQSFLSIIMPLISGLLITYFGFQYVFVIAMIVHLTSYIPFLALPRTREKFSWSYKKTLKKFFENKNRKLVVANMANGAENAVTVVIWPIFIWQVLNGDYFTVGALSSLIVLVAVVLQLAVGKYTDVFNKRSMIHWGSFFYAFGWLVKIFILTGFQIFLAGAYHSFAKIFKDTPFDTLNYELIADQGHYVDEYTVLKEMAVNSGKALMLVFAAAVAITLGLNWTFGLAALASLLINFL